MAQKLEERPTIPADLTMRVSETEQKLINYLRSFSSATFTIHKQENDYSPVVKVELIKKL